jgi:hypothetical protein
LVYNADNIWKTGGKKIFFFTNAEFTPPPTQILLYAADTDITLPPTQILLCHQ